MIRSTRAFIAGVTLAASAGLFSACSTADGLLASDEIDLGILASATNDVVLHEGFAIQSAPVCETEDKSEVTYTCTGRTMDGESIDVKVTGPESQSDVTTGSMVVVVGSERIFSGPVQDVLDQRMLATNS